MSVHIFVAPEALRPGPLEVQGEEHHYLSHVRRLRVGDALVLLDGAGAMARATILAIGAKSSSLEVGERELSPSPAFHLCVAPALIKGERMDWALSKMSELGVHQLRPMSTERSIVKLRGDRAQQRHKRFESLVLAAARQSRNPLPPRVEAIATFSGVLQSASAELILIPYLGENSRPLREVLPDAAPASALVLIGPEGGFTEAEAQAAREAGALAVDLGPRVLRAETACIAMASILAFRYGDVGSR